jgi:hypothetical protein
MSIVYKKNTGNEGEWKKALQQTMNTMDRGED